MRCTGVLRDRMKGTTAVAGALAAMLAMAVSGQAVVSAGASLDAKRVAKGAELAAIGNCVTCHTREGGKPLAGGRSIATPFGTIYSTNITPDPGTGIGRWSEADFRQALHEGIDREGRDLYPAFPYDHFTRVTDEDVSALYAWAMTRDPVRANVPRNRLRFPMSLRASIKLWKAAYFRPGVYRFDPSRSAEWNRGAYLVEGLAHCGACHTPRNALGAERDDRALEGGDAEGWHATSLSRRSPAPVHWTAEALYAYLRTGQESRHGTAAGPMVEVTHNLAQVSEGDVRAIAAYIAEQMPETEVEPPPHRERAASEEGSRIFAGACAVCHAPVPPTFSGAVVPLGLTTSLNSPDARNAIHVIMEGLHPESGEKGAWMPEFATELTDSQMAALVDYLRLRFTDGPAWPDVPREVSTIRQALKEEP